ncbi:hypothetical protein [uncultured Marinobacter sp.]|uniref:hypothetical protein n=1 Tax=uncultured Marinobacter sp. TaxID=187379 RepID=UPI0026311F89|nr:hypothetical protein [uncultured Marinobacter sp.]
MEYQYLGWIPCISGHLDFGLMKPGISGGFTNKYIKDNKTNHINFGYLAQKDHHARRVMLQSKVNWQDRLNDKEYDGSFRVFVLAEASESACMDNRELLGSVYVYPTSEQEGSKAENREKPWFQTIHEAQEVYDRSNGNVNGWDDSRSQLNQCYDRLKIELEAMGFWRVDFKATSGGLVYLSTPTEQHRSLSDNEKYLITRQAYYYIKYSLHSHKHHQAEQDSLTTIVPYSRSRDGRRDAALKMLCQLKRELTHIKRTLTQEQGLYSDDALGILSYMGSLLTTLHTRKLIDGDLHQREGRYIDSLRSSFQVQESRTRNFRSIEDSTRSTYRVYIGWTLALVSLFFGIVARPFYAPVPESELLNIPSLGELALFVPLILLVATLLYRKVTAHMISTKLDEASVRYFVQARYHQSNGQLVRTFLSDNRNTLFIFALLVIGAFAASLI